MGEVRNLCVLPRGVSLPPGSCKLNEFPDFDPFEKKVQKSVQKWTYIWPHGGLSHGLVWCSHHWSLLLLYHYGKGSIYSPIYFLSKFLNMLFFLTFCWTLNFAQKFKYDFGHVLSRNARWRHARSRGWNYCSKCRLTFRKMDFCSDQHLFRT